MVSRVVDGGFDRGSKKSSDVTETTEKAVTTSTGKRKVIPKKADFNSMSAGGLY